MILLSFDVEEFDLPLEHHVNISLEEQLRYSKDGVRIVLDLLEEHNINATFFSTAVFALNSEELIKEIIQHGHEIASHGYNHSSFVKEDLIKSKSLLEKISGKPVNGYRQAFMMKTPVKDIADAGYLYDSSVNPTFIPGRYNNLNLSRKYYQENGILRIPASVTPLMRIPLFWLSMHNLPFSLYYRLCNRTIEKDNYLNIYLHPWEFSDCLNNRKLKVPAYIVNNSGTRLKKRLDCFIREFVEKGESFHTFSDFFTYCMNQNSIIDEK